MDSITNESDNDQSVEAKQLIEYENVAGHVEFDLGEVSHPTFGSIKIHSKFPRLQPKLERGFVKEEDIKTLHSTLMTWIQKHFDTTSKADYFHELAQASTLFTIYVNPLAPLESVEMDMAIKIYFWLWYLDDEIEAAIENNVPFELLQQGTDQLSDLLSRPAPPEVGLLKFKEIPNYPSFTRVFAALSDLHQMCTGQIPNYQKRLGPMRFYLQRYFEAQRWYCVDGIDHRYSEETFRNWRRIIAYFDGIAEVTALIHGVSLPPEIFRSPTLHRILDIANSFGGFVNDVLGMKKEFRNGQRDNLIIFKVLNKNIGLEEAVEQVCGMMETELSDYLLLKKVILKEFGEEENLVRYLDILDSLIDGHNMIYPESGRHRSAHCVRLTR